MRTALVGLFALAAGLGAAAVLLLPAWAAVGLLFVIAAASAWVFERRVFRAASEAAGSIERLSKGDLEDYRATLAAYPELQDLVGPMETVRQKLLEQRRAEAAALAKSQILANLSHELRTPMTGVMGLADLLQQTALTPKQRSLVDNLHDSADLLLTLVDDVLVLSKLDEQALRLESIDFDLGRAVRLVCNLLQPKATQKGIELDAWIDPEVPPVLVGDPTRLQQVLFNLVGNAIKFTESGSVRVEIRGHASPGGIDLVLDVIDTGIGIPAARLPHLFDRYEQGDPSTHRSFGGSGLGLTISKRLIGLMNGTIGVSSQVGEGTRFRVELTLPVGDPTKISAGPTVDALDGRASSEPPPGWAKGLKLLVAEDHEMNREMLRLLAEQEGFRVTTAHDGRAALEAVRGADFDMVLMDVQMPEMDGLEATRHIRRLAEPRCRVPVVALTADATKALRSEEEGLDGFLLKPFHRSRFVRMAHDLLRDRRSADALQAAPSVVDGSRLDHLSEHLPASDLTRLIERFTDRVRSEVGVLQEALADEDAVRIKAQSHRLAGFAANFGATGLAEWARGLEQSGPLPESWEQAQSLMESTVEELDRWTAPRSDRQTARSPG